MGVNAKEPFEVVDASRFGRYALPIALPEKLCGGPRWAVVSPGVPGGFRIGGDI